MSDTLLKLSRNGNTFVVRFHWGISRARDTYGYNICSAFVDGRKVGSCNGGGYDMQRTALAPWLEKQVKPSDAFYGLSWHDPNYNTPKDVVEREKAGESFGLERYQAFYSASSKTRTRKHTVPSIDGGCGLESILRHLGFSCQAV